MLCYFNLAGAIYNPDVEGVEMETISDARIYAARHAAELINDRPELVWMGEEVRVEVTDADQLILFTVIIFGVDAAAALGHPATFRPE